MLIYVQRIGPVEVPLPQYQTEGSAGFDLHAAIENPIKLLPRSAMSWDPIKGYGTKNWELIPSGLSMEIPEYFEAQIRPRSGLALKHGISIVNSPGTIDSDYRGPISVIIINHGVDIFTINPLDRIAQMVISPVIQAKFKFVDSLTETERGAGGFGSTGGFIKHGS